MIRAGIVGTGVEIGSGTGRTPAERSPGGVTGDVELQRSAGGENGDVVLSTGWCQSPCGWSSEPPIIEVSDIGTDRSYWITSIIRVVGAQAIHRREEGGHVGENEGRKE